MSGFTDMMIEDGFDDPQEYMNYLENQNNYHEIQDEDSEIEEEDDEVDDYDKELDMELENDIKKIIMPLKLGTAMEEYYQGVNGDDDERTISPIENI